MKLEVCLMAFIIFLFLMIAIFRETGEALFVFTITILFSIKLLKK